MLDLSPYKKFFKKIWVLENNESSILKKTGPMVSDARLEIIFVLGNGYKAIFEKEAFFCNEGIYVGGHLDQRLELEIMPYTKMISVKMEPWTASLLSKYNFQHSLNRTIPLKELNPSLNTKLRNLNIEFQQKRMMDLLGQEVVQGLSRHPDFKLIFHGSQLLENNFLNFKEAKRQLLFETKLSSRSLEMKFNQYLGLTPQKFANTIRFRKITENIYHDVTSESLTALAYQYGYYDQAHFIRTCQRILGISPKLLSPNHCFITNPKDDFRYYTI